MLGVGSRDDEVRGVFVGYQVLDRRGVDVGVPRAHPCLGREDAFDGSLEQISSVKDSEKALKPDAQALQVAPLVGRHVAKPVIAGRLYSFSV